MIPQPNVDTIYKIADIVEITGLDTTLKPTSNGFTGRCPFDDHDDKTPSFHVYPDSRLFVCYGCGRKGDVVKYVMEKQNCSWIEGIRWLGKYYGVSVEDAPRDPEEAARIAKLKEARAALETDCLKYEEALKKHPEAMQYLQARGISEATIRRFNLGYGCLKNRYRDRITFAIRDEHGQCIGFAGRILPKSDLHSSVPKGKKPSKYINSSETDLYKKRTTLYGIDQAKSALRNAKTGYLVEGYTDVLAMHQAGITNTVATCGTALTPEQVALLKRYTPHITLLFDGDKAGQKATISALELVLQGGMLVDVVHLPDGQDPAEYLASASPSSSPSCTPTPPIDAIAPLRKDFLTYLLGTIPEGADVPTRVAVHKTIVKAIATIPDSEYRHEYSKEFSVRTDRPLEKVQEEVQALVDVQLRSKRASTARRSTPQPSPNQRKMTADGSHYLVNYRGSFPISFEIPISVAWAKRWCELDKRYRLSTSTVRQWIALEGDLACAVVIHGDTLLECAGERATVRELIQHSFREADKRMEVTVLDRIVLGNTSGGGSASDNDAYNYETDIVRICSEIHTGKKLWDMELESVERKDVDLVKMMESVMQRYGEMVRKWEGIV